MFLGFQYYGDLGVLVKLPFTLKILFADENLNIANVIFKTIFQSLYLYACVLRGMIVHISDTVRFTFVHPQYSHFPFVI